MGSKAFAFERCAVIAVAMPVWRLLVLSLAGGLGSFLCVAAQAQLIESFATGAHLAGGKVTVTFFGGPMATGTITASGTTGTATFPGSFLFTVAGETSVADWTLTNLDSGPAARAITAVSIDLTDSISLFDDGSTPSTPVSLTGVAGATYVSGPAIAGSGEVNPWTSASNLGDMFTAESISWGGFMIPAIVPGATAVWHDDTDRIVPEPSALLHLLAFYVIATLTTGRLRSI
jgi:hypothetical protein